METPPENSTIINICVIPNDQVGQDCVDISQSLKSDKTAFVLGDGKFAHMTVFMARFGNDKVNDVVRSVRDTLANEKSLQCEHTGYFMTEGRYLEISYRRSKEFTALHENLINAVSGLRINPGDPYEEGYFTPYTVEQQQNAKETGYDLARTLFRPHITLTRYVEGGVPTTFPAFPAAELSFSLTKVCIYKADDNGAVYELLEEFKIG